MIVKMIVKMILCWVFGIHHPESYFDSRSKLRYRCKRCGKAL